MQKLAMMMAVMILGMSPAHACSISADPGSLEVGGLVEMMICTESSSRRCPGVPVPFGVAGSSPRTSALERVGSSEKAAFSAVAPF